MSIIRAAEAPKFELPGAMFTAYAAPSRGSAETCAWTVTIFPGDRDNATHTLDRDEVFLVKSGTVTVTPGGDALHPGDCAIVPAGQSINVKNVGDEPAEMFVSIAAGFTATMADGTSVGTPPWAV